MKLETFKMKKQLNKIASAAAGVGIFFLGCVLAGFGLSVVFLLAMFALAVIGLGILVSPFLPAAKPLETEQQEKVVA
jgi:Na+-transporting methylmalonyl-CoA/oxaloacetate decarboxylase gamma subunit